MTEFAHLAVSELSDTAALELAVAMALGAARSRCCWGSCSSRSLGCTPPRLSGPYAPAL
jgi:hypothetical protein